MILDWSTFKSFVDSRSLSVQWFENPKTYFLKAFDGVFSVETVLDRDPSDTTWLVDFETNYKAVGNKRLAQVDKDGSALSRNKITETGWRYDPRSLDWVTSKALSLYNRKPTAYTISGQADIGDAVMKFFDSTGAELVKGGGESDSAFQTRLGLNCTSTAVNWQPTYDMEIIGATITVRGAPTIDAYLWAIIAPDIPEAYGGRATFGSGGFNLSHMNINDKIEINGRASKKVVYDPVYNTNKFQFLISHAAGAQIGIQMFIEHYHG